MARFIDAKILFKSTVQTSTIKRRAPYIMAKPIDFYFEFSSPYGYLASTQIEGLAAEFGRQVNWQPILLGPMFKTTGSAPLTEIPMKGEYSKRDFARSAMLHNIPYVQPQPFPIGTVSAARAVVYLKEHDSANVAGFIKAVYRAYFAEGRNISETETVLAIADGLGIDAQKLADGIGQDDIKQRLKQEIDAAMARGVFGSPFMFVDGEPFWGFDRFDHIRRWLQRRD